MNKTALLEQKIVDITSYIPRSRVHALKTFHMPSVRALVKRDDELGFGISGSKWRKYTSLIPYLLHQKYREAVVIGGAYSNHVLGISQLLIENSIQPSLFLLGNPNLKCQGNLLLTSLLVPNSKVHWVSREDWPQVEKLATNYVHNNPIPTALIPEGGCMDAALPGALTLAVDILRNERENQIEFQHLFIDAGTGFSAIATILAFTLLNKEILVHVLLLAEEEREFLAKLNQFQQVFELFTKEQLNKSDLLKRFKTYRPTSGKSFGSVNTMIMKHIQFLAREEGFFTDPIYSAKLFLEAKNIITSSSLTGNILVIHSGGALSLMGFEKELKTV